MSKSQTLRALVNERLTAAAEEIFALFERTIAEYEEEVCRSKEENQRKQELLDSILSPSKSPGPGLNQDPPHTPRIKLEPEEPQQPQEPQEPEEPSVKQEEHTLLVQVSVGIPKSSAVCVKTEESSLLQQRQTELREETRGEDISAETHLHSSLTDNDENWSAPFSCSAAQMETDADGDHSQVQIRATGFTAQNSCLFPTYKSAPETSATVNNGDMSGIPKGAQSKRHWCSVCYKRFNKLSLLQNHIRVHTGEHPFSCSTCKKIFTQKSNLDRHLKIHTGERPYSCSICKKGFIQKCTLDAHFRTHTGERPFRCSICEKTFAFKCNLDVHVKIHAGQKPFKCSTCEKTFSQKCSLDAHLRTHTQVKDLTALQLVREHFHIKTN